MRHPNQALVGLTAIVSFLCVTGCSEELGPEKFVTTSVTGRLVTMGRGLGPGWIEFIPVEGTTGLMAVARIGPDGEFKADRVPVGKVAIALARLPGDSIQTSIGPISPRRFQFNVTPIRMTIPAVPEARVTLDMDVEAIRIAREQERIRKARGDEVE